MAVLVGDDVQAMLGNHEDDDDYDDDHDDEEEEEEEEAQAAPHAHAWHHDPLEGRDDEGEDGQGGHLAYFLKQVIYPLLLFPLSRFG